MKIALAFLLCLAMVLAVDATEEDKPVGNAQSEERALPTEAPKPDRAESIEEGDVVVDSLDPEKSDEKKTDGESGLEAFKKALIEFMEKIIKFFKSIADTEKSSEDEPGDHADPEGAVEPVKPVVAEDSSQCPIGAKDAEGSGDNNLPIH